MSRDIDEEIMAQFRANELTPVCLLEFTDGDNTYRYCDLDVPLNISVLHYDLGWMDDESLFDEWVEEERQWHEYTGTFGMLYAPLGFTFSSIRYSLGNIVDQATVTIENRDQVMTSIFVAGTIQGEEATFSIAVLDNAGDLIGVQNVFKGEIDSWELDEEEVKVVLSTPFARWAQQTTSLHSSSCRWKEFRGIECQYSGSQTWCDRSYVRCTVLANTQHFGGFRFLPDFENRQLAWGPNVETITT